MASYFGQSADYLTFIGAASLCYVALKVGRLLLRVAWRAVRRSFPVDLKKYGRWAVVTGSGDGIGKSYAMQLAEKGMDIVLISINPQELSSVAEQIVQQYKVEVKVITADFKKTDIYENIKQQLSGLDIGILVNNVGIVNRRTPEYFCEDEDAEEHSALQISNGPTRETEVYINYHRDIINVNVLSCVMMTGIVLPDMLERKRGTIINISSIAGLRPRPFYSVYSGTKVFLRFFSEALNMEYSSQGVTVQVVSPGLVVSKMAAKMAEANGTRQGLFYPMPDVYVRSAIRTIGKECSTLAYWPHELQMYILSMMPNSVYSTMLLKHRNKMTELLKAECPVTGTSAG